MTGRHQRFWLVYQVRKGFSSLNGDEVHFADARAAVTPEEEGRPVNFIWKLDPGASFSGCFCYSERSVSRSKEVAWRHRRQSIGR